MQKIKILTIVFFALAFSCSAQSTPQHANPYDALLNGLSIKRTTVFVENGLYYPDQSRVKIAAPLTIEAVKECIAFPKGELLHTTLCNMVDCWYGIAKNEGATDEQAANIALDKLGAKMLEFSKPKK